MEVIQQDQLEQYEEIIEKINKEFEKSSTLRAQVERENDQILAQRLASTQQTNPVVFSDTSVKIFDDLNEIWSLYQHELKPLDIQPFQHLTNCKFYLVEVFIHKNLQEKFYSSNYMLNISVKCPNSWIINKTIALKKRSPITQVIPVDKTVKECLIKTKIFDRDFNTFLDLQTINVDISYFFQTFKTTKQKTNEVLLLANLYNQGVENDDTTISSTLSIESCKIPDIIQSFLQNSYHRIDMEIFANLASEENARKCSDLTLTLDQINRLNINIDQLNKQLTIKGQIQDVTLVKKYLIKQLGIPYPSVENEAALQGLLRTTGLEDDDFDFVQFHYQLRKLFL